MRRSILLVMGLGLTVTMALAQPGPARFGYLERPSFEIDRKHRLPWSPYCPRPGDIMFSTTNILIFRLGHNLAGAGEPSHSGIVFRKSDGSMGVLEAGPFDTLHIDILDLEKHLPAYDKDGRVWIRPRSVPPTAEQSCRLTEFAEREAGKRFAMLRVWAQITPFRARGPLRTWCLGGPHGPDRRKYYCAELVVEAMVYAGMVDAADARPSATYPSDMFHDWSRNPFLDRHFKLTPCWGVPSRWSPCPLPPG